MKRFAITDIHGAYKALIQVLQKCNFNYEEDELICMGDVCDGWPEVKECYDELLKIKNLIYIAGNHDKWFQNYFDNVYLESHPWADDYYDQTWINEGGNATLKSYSSEIPLSHRNLIKNGLAYYIDNDNRIFLHGGFDPNVDIKIQDPDDLRWNRNLIYTAQHKQFMHKNHGHINKISEYNEIFIGHTPTLNFGKQTLPINFAEVWLIDTGASYNGPLTIIDIETKEYWQSDLVNVLYPGKKGR